MSKRLSLEYIKHCGNTIHHKKYDYSKVKYKSIKEKVIIICPIHGEFEQSIESHIRKKAGCSKCFGNNKSTTAEFILKAIQYHGKKYDYSKVKYTTSHHKVTIICPIHGAFEQLPGNHLNKSAGCPVCNESKGEKKVSEILTDLNITFQRQCRFEKCRDKYTLPFDFFLTDYNICIEFDGIQHFIEQGLFNNLEDTIKKDNIKTTYCLKNNIKLIRIKYDNIQNILEILKKEICE